MKKQITPKNILYFGIIATIIYLAAIESLYGQHPSISHYFKYHIQNNTWYLGIGWLISVLITTSSFFYFYRTKQTLLLALSGITLFPIAIFTGYSGVINTNLENIIHVAEVYIAIPLALAYIIWDAKKRLWIPLISSFVLFTVYAMWTGKIDRHTYWIEVFCFAIVFIYLLIKINKPCQKETLK